MPDDISNTVRLASTRSRLAQGASGAWNHHAISSRPASGCPVERLDGVQGCFLLRQLLAPATPDTQDLAADYNFHGEDLCVVGAIGAYRTVGWRALPFCLNDLLPGET